MAIPNSQSARWLSFVAESKLKIETDLKLARSQDYVKLMRHNGKVIAQIHLQGNSEEVQILHVPVKLNSLAQCINKHTVFKDNVHPDADFLYHCLLEYHSASYCNK